MKTTNTTKAKIAAAKKKSQRENLTARFDQAIKAVAPHIAATMSKEHRFHEVRKWRFDRAWTSEKVAVELHGGTWIQGGHSRGAGQSRDFEKLNHAQALGWKVFQFSIDMLREKPVECAVIVAEAVIVSRNQRGY